MFRYIEDMNLIVVCVRINARKIEIPLYNQYEKWLFLELTFKDTGHIRHCTPRLAELGNGNPLAIRPNEINAHNFRIRVNMIDLDSISW